MSGDIRDKLVSSFIVGIGFWLISDSDYSSLSKITSLISALGILSLFVYSIKAIKTKYNLLGWSGLVTSAWMMIPFIIEFIRGFLNY